MSHDENNFRAILKRATLLLKVSLGTTNTLVGLYENSQWHIVDFIKNVVHIYNAYHLFKRFHIYHYHTLSQLYFTFLTENKEALFLHLVPKGRNISSNIS